MSGPSHTDAPRQAVLQSLWDLVENELLPTYEEAMSFAHGGWTRPAGVDAGDAEWFIAAVRSGLVEPTRAGDLGLPASPYAALVFWEGPKDTEPRQISFAMEGFLSTATAARLHMLHGWPRESLGFESEDDAFDLIGMVPGRPNEHLAGEAKPTSANVAALIRGVRSCGEKGAHDSCLSGPSGRKNAHRKWAGLVRSKAPVFLVFGPAHEWHVFRVDYGPDEHLSLGDVDESFLAYPSGARTDDDGLGVPASGSTS